MRHKTFFPTGQVGGKAAGCEETHLNCLQRLAQPCTNNSGELLMGGCVWGGGGIVFTRAVKGFINI